MNSILFLCFNFSFCFGYSMELAVVGLSSSLFLLWRLKFFEKLKNYTKRFSVHKSKIASVLIEESSCLYYISFFLLMEKKKWFGVCELALIISWLVFRRKEILLLLVLTSVISIFFSKLKLKEKGKPKMKAEPLALDLALAFNTRFGTEEKPFFSVYF